MEIALPLGQLELSDADFLVVSAVPADAIENGESPLEAEEFVELPEISLPLFAELCAILIGKPAATVAKKLKVVAVIEPEGMDPAQLIPLPEEITLAFSSLKSSGVKDLAKRWRTAEEFPADNITAAQANEMVKELSRVGSAAASDDWILVVSQF